MGFIKILPPRHKARKKINSRFDPTCHKCNKSITNKILQKYGFCKTCLPQKDKCYIKLRNGRRCQTPKRPGYHYCQYHLDKRNLQIERLDDTGFVYIISLGFDNLYKIGKTKNVERRLKELSAANPLLKLITSAQFSDCGHVENNYHKMYESYHVERELFRFSQKTVNEIITKLHNLTKI